MGCQIRREILKFDSASGRFVRVLLVLVLVLCGLADRCSEALLKAVQSHTVGLLLVYRISESARHCLKQYNVILLVYYWFIRTQRVRGTAQNTTVWYGGSTVGLLDLRECEALLKAIQCDIVGLLLVYQNSESARHCLKQYSVIRWVYCWFIGSQRVRGTA